ncbi:S-layer homology domain-containing protein [Candidatus Epulonipiscium viviparus]|uniref:S-layer homology domain-containing protein n=1 Tax=Candidatus Epulonipiscium viviparus TaxID=420336 RepID=UPI00273810F2|nr:S-layer homology domain-containing protein [Candidatus Epulopiscium viviparus]
MATKMMTKTTTKTTTVISPLKPTPAKPTVTTTPTAPTAPLPPISIKKDVSPSAWYYNDVKWIYEQGLMFGLSVDQFGIGVHSTRGSIANVLALHGNIDLTKYPSSLRWFDSSMKWASEYKLFGSDIADGATPLTRESMAVLINNYLKYQGFVLPKASATTKFTDIKNLSAEKQNAIKIANQLGLLSGKSATTMAPKDLVTMEEVAAIVHRVDSLLLPKTIAHN